MSDNQKTFREETRAWLEENCPASMRTPMPASEYPWGGRNAVYPNRDTPIWLERMAAKGWTTPQWPEVYGGAGLDSAHASILQQELDRIQARPPIFSFGYWMLGPVLLEYATEEQKRRFLPPITRGEIRWCQGYSEPGAGSDLASLKTRAEIKDDRIIINGSKIWTSEADKSDWIFCLVRTDFDAPKHRGISFVLFDLESPGVTRRPIKLISGASPFCETFFDNVEVPLENLVGPLNGGWEIAKRLLQYERQNVAAAGFGAESGPTLIDLAKQYAGDGHSLEDPVLRDKIAHYAMRQDAIEQLTERMNREQGASSLASVLKVVAAKNNQVKGELTLEALGHAALGWDKGGHSDQELKETRAWLRGKGNSIEGGTSEINLNIIAKRTLGLPDPKQS